MYAGASAGSATYVYENGSLKFFFTPEGYVEPPSTGSGAWQYVYQYKDHLGNIRLSYTDRNGDGVVTKAQAELVEEHNYYPFGLEHQGYNGDVSGSRNKYITYNGKELNESLDLNIIEMDFRQYDPALGRFNVMDGFAMLAPGITPYRFSFNNPIYWSDPSGLYEIDEDGNIEVNNKNGNEEIAKILTYLKNNTGASIDDIAGHIFSSGDFAYDLDEVVVMVGSASSEAAALKDLTSQINNASSKISSFSGNIISNSIINSNSKYSKATDFASGALTGLSNFRSPSSVVGVAMNAQVKGNSLSNGAINNLARINQLARGTTTLARAAPAVSVGFALYDISNAYVLDGSQFGYNSTVTTSKSVGSIAGGWLGVKAGAAVGISIGLWFGGVGAVPGAIIGGIIGGAAGSFYGAKAGEAVGEQIADQP